MVEFKRTIGPYNNNYKTAKGSRYVSGLNKPFNVADKEDVAWFRNENQTFVEITPVKTVVEKVALVVKAVKKEVKTIKKLTKKSTKKKGRGDK